MEKLVRCERCKREMTPRSDGFRLCHRKNCREIGQHRLHGGGSRLTLKTTQTARRNLYNETARSNAETPAFPEAPVATPRECGICGESFYAVTGFVCDDCDDARAVNRETWEDSDTFFDGDDPGYKIYRARHWIPLPDFPHPYDYIGWTGRMRMRERILGEYPYLKRFPELETPGVEYDITVLRRYPWSVEGHDQSVIAEVIEILESAIATDTVTLNYHYVPKDVRMRDWGVFKTLRRQLARQGLV